MDTADRFATDTAARLRQARSRYLDTLELINKSNVEVNSTLSPYRFPLTRSPQVDNFTNAAFDAIDSNHDGVISRGEFDAAFPAQALANRPTGTCGNRLLWADALRSSNGSTKPAEDASSHLTKNLFPGDNSSFDALKRLTPSRSSPRNTMTTAADSPLLDKSTSTVLVQESSMLDGMPVTSRRDRSASPNVSRVRSSSPTGVDSSAAPHKRTSPSPNRTGWVASPSTTTTGILSSFDGTLSTSISGSNGTESGSKVLLAEDRIRSRSKERPSPTSTLNAELQSAKVVTPRLAGTPHLLTNSMAKSSQPQSVPVQPRTSTLSALEEKLPSPVVVKTRLAGTKGTESPATASPLSPIEFAQTVNRLEECDWICIPVPPSFADEGRALAAQISTKYVLDERGLPPIQASLDLRTLDLKPFWPTALPPPQINPLQMWTPDLLPGPLMVARNGSPVS